MSTLITLPKEVQELIDTIAERYGYYAGKRVITSEMMKATASERKQIRDINSKIEEKLSKDEFDDVKKLKEELERVKGELRKKSEPFIGKMRPLNKALSFLDKVVIPKMIEDVTGRKVTPKFEVSPQLAKALGLESQ